MKSAQGGHLKKLQKLCSICQKKLKPGEDYHHHSKTLCDDCCIEIRTQRVRKTHWQYLRSIKTEYLIPEKNK